MCFMVYVQKIGLSCLYNCMIDPIGGYTCILTIEVLMLAFPPLPIILWCEVLKVTPPRPLGFGKEDHSCQWGLTT